jgi:uncharacterized protein involved in outer membrane biogenesis
MAGLRVRRWHAGIAVAVVSVAVLVAVWDWDWFIPPVQRMVSARLGRPVTIQHLHLRIARNPVFEADGVVVGNPPELATADAPLARIDRLAVMVNGPAYLRGRVLIVPSIEIDHPQIAALAQPDGRNNWTFPFSGKPSGGPSIGDLIITDGHVHAVVPKLKADFQIDVATQGAQGDKPSTLEATAHGTYSGQPIDAHFVGGALLSLRDKTNPYPVDLRLQNGATRVALRGTVQDPLAFAGTNLKLELTGDSLAALTPLSGVPVPSTPPFRVTGNLGYADQRLRFDDFAGRVGNSDIGGVVSIDPGNQRPQVTADLHSERVDLADFSALLGAAPGRAGTSGETAQQKAEVRREEASPDLLPTTPLNVPRLSWADMDIHYRGAHIQGRSMPLDNVIVTATVKDGALRLHPIDFGVGTGQISADIALDKAAAPSGEGKQAEAAPAKRSDMLRARADVQFRQVDVARLFAATHAFGGSGSIGGHATLEGTGDSIAGIAATSNGDLKLFMVGGDLSALLVDLSGLEFGNAVISALGLPKRTDVRCLVADFTVRDGIANTRTLVLDTNEANVTGKGDINLRNQTIDYQLDTQAKHFSIGSLPAPVDITGRLKSPHVMPDTKQMGARGAAAAGLGVLLTPLAALLPTIQLGLGENNNCGALIRNAQNSPSPTAKPADRSSEGAQR